MPHKITHYGTKNPSEGKFPLKSEDVQSLYKMNPQVVFFKGIELHDYDLNSKDSSDASSETEDNKLPKPLMSLFNPEYVNFSEDKIKSSVIFDTKTIKKHIPKTTT